VTRVVVATRGWTAWPDYAGHLWVPIQYVAGLQRLGVDAWWVDHLKPVDPRKHPHSIEYLMKRLEQTAQQFGFGDRYSVVYDGSRHFGRSASDVAAMAEGADLLLGLSCKRLPGRSPLLSIPRRAYVDLDPGFTQIWAHQTDMGFDQFQQFFTVGQNVPETDFPIPNQGIEWQSMLPPVVLSLWPGEPDPEGVRYSTVGDWWGKQYTRFEGEYYGSKRDEFLRFVEVPARADVRVEIALAIYQGDHKEIALLDKSKWHLRDPYLYAGDLDSYREFIRYSRGEFSVAKGGYVKSRSGWVSDRTACYLASARPALVQETGLEGHLPTGSGLLTFRTPDEAIAGFEAIEERYLEHAEAARAIAEEHFDSDKVLARMLHAAGL
jgi:hypothetical protein